LRPLLSHRRTPPLSQSLCATTTLRGRGVAVRGREQQLAGRRVRRPTANLCGPQEGARDGRRNCLERVIGRYSQRDADAARLHGRANCTLTQHRRRWETSARHATAVVRSQTRTRNRPTTHYAPVTMGLRGGLAYVAVGPPSSAANLCLLPTRSARPPGSRPRRGGAQTKKKQGSGPAWARAVAPSSNSGREGDPIQTFDKRHPSRAGAASGKHRFRQRPGRQQARKDALPRLEELKR